MSFTFVNVKKHDSETKIRNNFLSFIAVCDSSPQEYGERNTLDMKDFEVTDLLGNGRPIVVGSSDQLSADDQREVVSPLPISSLGVQTLTTSVSAASVGDAGPIRELQLLAHQPYVIVNTDLTCEMEYLMIPDDRPM